MKRVFKSIGNRLCLTKQSRRCRPWFAIDGDSTLRLEYPLNEDSVVFDLGGYKGQWASDIFSKYCCNLYVFEPVIAFYEAIENRFKQNSKIRTFPFGLAEENKKVVLGLDKDRSSMFKRGDENEVVVLHGFKDFLHTQQIKNIDLIKINIEGAEYDLLDSIIKEGLQTHIRDIQVQFHGFVPDAENRMKGIQKMLEQTHEMTWQYPFVWENWKIRNCG